MRLLQRNSGKCNLPDAKTIRSYFALDNNNPGSLQVSLLSMLVRGATTKIPSIDNVPTPYRAYLSMNTCVYDLSCLALACTEAGGVALDLQGNDINPFAEWAHIASEHSVIATRAFVLAPSKKYAKKVLDVLTKNNVIL